MNFRIEALDMAWTKRWVVFVDWRAWYVGFRWYKGVSRHDPMDKTIEGSLGPIHFAFTYVTYGR